MTMIKLKKIEDVSAGIYNGQWWAEIIIANSGIVGIGRTRLLAVASLFAAIYHMAINRLTR